MPMGRPASGSDRVLDDVIVGPLVPLLGAYGLSARVTRDHGALLRVSNADGPATFVYVAGHPVLGEPAVYGFVDLYVGVVADLGRVAARLAWLLGADQGESPTPKTERCAR
jgi:hypothetical protein